MTESAAVAWSAAHSIRQGRVSVDVTATDTADGPRYTYRIGRIAGRPGEEKRSGYLRPRDIEDTLLALDELRDWLIEHGAV